MNAIKNLKDSGLGSLTRLGFESISDCLLAVPKEYRDFTNPIKDIKMGKPEQKLDYFLKFVTFKMFDDKGIPTSSMRDCKRLQMTFSDINQKTIMVSVFGGAFSWKHVIYNKEPRSWLLWGRYDEFNNQPVLRDIELIHDNLLGKVAAVYAGKVGRVSGQKVQEGVVLAMNYTEDAAMTLVSKVGLRDHQFTKYAGMPAREFINKLHWPKTIEEGLHVKELASKISMFGLVQSAVDYRIKTPSAKASIKISGEAVAQLVSSLPFNLTNDQTKAIQAIVQGLREPFPSLDLISADVGVGKSITFMVPAAAAAMAGARVGIMAPSTLLAEQLYNEMKEYFPQLDIGLVLAGGRIENAISISTTSLIGAAKRSKVSFNLAIVDEQHKFGSEQRMSLIKDHTNMIESTATPIPRSIALVSYGGYRLLHMTECPVKKAIFTRVVDKTKKKEAVEFISKVVTEGGQVAVVYPGVEKTEDGNGSTVKDAAVRWEAKYPSRVGMIHGKLTEDEKAQVILDMKAKKYDVLIASTLIEVGITLPSLKCIAAVDAENFGLAQLHQLRGRVARKGGKGYCFLLPSDDCEPEAIERLKILEQCTDGYELAERDMENRGFGNLDQDADSQHGKTQMILWNAKMDAKTIEQMASNLPKILAEIN